MALIFFKGQRRLNDTYSGGIGSFMLCCMVVSFLQHKHRLAYYNHSTPIWNIGALLLEFFQLYGITFNYYTTGISVTNGGKYFPKSQWNNISEAANK